MRNQEKYEVKFLKCLICDDGKEYGRLHKHLISSHNISSKQYTIQRLYAGIEPVCKCGCGYKTRYVQFSFKEFHKGHNANRKGIKLSNEQIEKLSEIGKKRVAENPKWFTENMLNAQISCHSEAAERKRTKTLQIYWSKEDNHIKKSTSAKKTYVDHPELREKTSQHFKQWHANLTEEEKQERYNDDWKDKISESITNKYLDGGFEWSRGTFFSTKMKETFYYRSSWELRYMKELDQDSSVISWIYEPFWVPYSKDGDKHRHIPDFVIEYLDGHKEIHEVGVKKLKEEKFAEKVSAIKNFCAANDYLFKIVEFF